MKSMEKALVGSVLVAMISVIFFSIPTVTAAGPLDLTGVKNFALLANTFTAGAGTTLNGDLGYTVPPATLPTVNGITFISTDSTYISAQAIQAMLIASANNSTQSGACTTTLTAATVLDSLAQPLTPGVYCITGAVSINEKITLSGDGVYIFRMGGALNTVANSVVNLVGDAKADNVFWVPVGATTLGANSVFAGNVLSDAAITVSTTVTMDGRILSNGAVTTGALATIIAPIGITPPVDTTPPVITLLGPNPQIIQDGGVYTELGASVSDLDNVGLVVTIVSTAVNTNLVGSYLVTYNAVDTAGNHATLVTRTVNVVAIITPPTVTPGIISLFDQISCEAPSVGGVWDYRTSECTVTTLVIGPGDNLVVASNVVFNIGTVTSSGSIENWGTINIASGGVITTSGIFRNHGLIASNNGTITNSGPFNNFGTLASSGTITNGPTGVIQNSGIITSSGVITSSGTILVNETGKLINAGGILTNTLNLVNNGTIMTSGTFTNSGPVENTGSIENQGLITNSNSITNTFGSISNLCGGSITNSGTITVHTVQNICVA